jgi:hypothetical protein
VRRRFGKNSSERMIEQIHHLPSKPPRTHSGVAAILRPLFIQPEPSWFELLSGCRDRNECRPLQIFRALILSWNSMVILYQAAIILRKVEKNRQYFTDQQNRSNRQYQPKHFDGPRAKHHFQRRQIHFWARARPVQQRPFIMAGAVLTAVTLTTAITAAEWTSWKPRQRGK